MEKLIAGKMCCRLHAANVGVEGSTPPTLNIKLDTKFPKPDRKYQVIYRTDMVKILKKCSDLT
uniref:Uncharacterized protein n=1 Tax=Romanomermis culicivorax TaxID=13658 RepID=A0A915KB25_ROMCU